MLRNSRYLFCAAALFAAVFMCANAAFAAKGGNGGGKPGGGGEDPEPDPVELPLIEYQVTHIAPPYPQDENLSVHLNDFSDSGVAVGFYTTLGERRAWIYDPNLNTTSTAVDLNDLLPAGLEGYIMHSAVGVNNNGLVVGYASSTGDIADRRGFLLDLVSMEFSLLPDGGMGWEDTYGRRVNDNGDILGYFRDADGTYGVYLYNPGLRTIVDENGDIISGGPVSTDGLEIVNVFAYNDVAFNMNNPLPGSGIPTQIVGTAADGSVCEYTRGNIDVSYRTNLLSDLVRGLYINDYGSIAGQGTVDIEVQVRKNKTRIETVNYLYLDTGEEEDIEIPTDYQETRGLTNDGTVLLNYGTLYVDVDDWGFIDVELLLESGETMDLANDTRINNFGLPGFPEIAIGAATELQILTPVEIAP